MTANRTLLYVWFYGLLLLLLLPHLGHERVKPMGEELQTSEHTHKCGRSLRVTGELGIG